MVDPTPNPSRPNGGRGNPPVHMLSPTLVDRIVGTITTPRWPIHNAALKALAWADVGFDPDSLSKLRWSDCIYLMPGENSIWYVPGEGEVELPGEATEWLVGWERAHGDADDDMLVFHQWGTHNRPKRGCQIHPADVISIFNDGLPLSHVPEPSPGDLRDVSAILLSATALEWDTRQTAETRWTEVWQWLEWETPPRPWAADERFAVELRVALSGWHDVYRSVLGLEGEPTGDEPVFVPLSGAVWDDDWERDTDDPCPDPVAQPLTATGFRAIWRRRGMACGFPDVNPESKILRHPRPGQPPTEEPY